MDKLSLILNGRPASAKNSKRIFHKGGKVIVLHSKAYTRFLNEQAATLYQVPKEQRFLKDEHLEVKYYFFQKGSMTQDIDNAQTTINDVLQTTGIIGDDEQIKRAYQVIVPNAEQWQTIVVIEVLTDWKIRIMIDEAMELLQKLNPFREGVSK